MSDLHVHGPQGYINTECMERRIENGRPEHLSSRRARKWVHKRNMSLDIQAIRANIPRDFKRMIRETDLPDVQSCMILSFILSNPVEHQYVVHSLDDEELDQYEIVWLDTSRYPHRAGVLIDTDRIEGPGAAVTMWDALNKSYQEPYASDPDPDEKTKELSQRRHGTLLGLLSPQQRMACERSEPTQRRRGTPPAQRPHHPRDDSNIYRDDHRRTIPKLLAQLDDRQT